ncbi:MAG: guanylate kinase [Erysipelotrichaceae bacterium]
MKKGLLIVLSGPSGVGKGTVLKRFIDNKELNLALSISMTTRSMRKGEQEGVNYYYVSVDQFKQAIENGELLEYAEFVGNYYGTPLFEVERLRNEGKNVILEIEVQGAQQVKSKCDDAISIFIIPPSMQELEQRIRGRSTESDEVIKARLEKAHKEMDLIEQYRYIVCNDDPELAAQLISVIIKRSMKQ